MYKKIKNSSFMNLIWFIICALPLVLLLIYALGFFNNEDLRTNEQDNYTLTLNSISGSTLKEQTNIFINLPSTEVDNEPVTNINANDNGYYTITLSEDQQVIQKNIINLNYTNNNYYFYLLGENVPLNKINSIGIFAVYNDNSTKLTNINTNCFNNEFLEYNLNEFKQQNKTIIKAYITIAFNQGNETFNIYPIITNEHFYYNTNWLNNYKTYVNNFNTIKYNSCPISYTYNNNTYNIETNSNNYLGTEEQKEINQQFNYNENENITLNYNNYFIKTLEQTIYTYGINGGNSITNEDYTIVKTYDYNFGYNSNYTYYMYVGAGEYQEFTTATDETMNEEYYNELTEEQDLYFIQESITTELEYYNIESTINTSLTLIPNNNFSDFLTNVNNTIQTNGFISSAFLNLSQFFGVNNIYYSLACYYIEYLLVIALLHLAFDILYMLPNICHKFMEKLGGERD